MKLIANSLVEIAGVTYKPGQALPRTDADHASELLAIGYAVPAAEQDVDESTDETADEAAEGEDVTGHLDAAQLETMTKAELEKLAADLGVDTKGLKTKAEIAAACAAVEVTAGGEAEGGEKDGADV